MTKTFPVLYQYTTKGQAQQWEIVVDFDQFYTKEGIVGGKITQSLPTVCYGKNIGKKNETTPFDQAEKEAQAKWDKKLASGYNLVLTAGSKFVEPMLAFEFYDYPIDWETEKMVYVQPKLDGLRAINENNTLMSRNGKPFTAPHLLQNELTLDGELYNHKFKDDFNAISSLFKTHKRTPEQILECEKLGQYWIYDLPYCPGTFGERYMQLLLWAATLTEEQAKKFKIVPTKVVHSQAELDFCHKDYLDQGYEGTIIRRDNAEYEFKRSKQLLKYKDFIDEEFVILDYGEGKGGRAGTIGYFWMHLDKDKPYHIDKVNDKKCVNVFKSNVQGNFTFLKDIWQNRDEYISKTATVKYFNRTPLKPDGSGNKPRFPYITKINREEYE